MTRDRSAVIFLLLLCLGAAALPPPASAEPLFVAVPAGGSAGIWRFEDGNGDGDALDKGEALLYAVRPLPEPPGFLDVATTSGKAMYAVAEGSRGVWRIVDGNGDGDALDAGEAALFRDEKAVGFALAGPLSIAVAEVYDPNSTVLRTLVYVMDLGQQAAVRLEDRNGDGKADAGDEVQVLYQSLPAAAFTAHRMALDGFSRLVAVNPNGRTVVRLDDVNQDGFIPEPEKQPCPPPRCGPVDFQEFQVIRTRGSGENTLEDPFGIAVAAGGTHFVSEGRPGRIVTALRDMDKDDDFMDAAEISLYYQGDGQGRGFDAAVGGKDIVYVGEQRMSGANVVTLLQDLNSDGDALDAGEAKTFADLSQRGTPTGLACPLVKGKAYQVFASDLPDERYLHVGAGAIAPLTLSVKNPDGSAASGVRVGAKVLSGCFAVCTDNPRSDAAGRVNYTVERTREPEEGTKELLKFAVSGGEALVTVVRDPCTPAPLAAAGADQTVFFGDAVTLDGSASSGGGLTYCWTQTGGPDVGLPDCIEGTAGEPAVTFTAPAAAATLTFMLAVRSACDKVSEDTVTVTVVESPCPARGLLGQGDPGLASLAAARDGFLAANPVGRRFTEGFSLHAAEVTNILRAAPPLRDRALPLLAAAAADAGRLRDGRPVVLARGRLEECRRFLADLGRQGSPTLQSWLRWVNDAVLSEKGLAGFGVKVR